MSGRLFASTFMSRAHVGIFWDYENCHFTGGCTGFDIAKNIESIARVHGSVTSFNAYLDPQLCTVPNSMRSELQSTGVALIDCPHNGQKNAADQMLQTDMLLFALDHPAPATIVLISGDRDFAYTTAVLRRRHYNVILMCHSQPGPHKSLLTQVSLHVDWITDILGLKEREYEDKRPILPQTPASPSPRASRHVNSPSMSKRTLERAEFLPVEQLREQSSRRAQPATNLNGLTSTDIPSYETLSSPKLTHTNLPTANNGRTVPSPPSTALSAPSSNSMRKADLRPSPILSTLPPNVAYEVSSIPSPPKPSPAGAISSPVSSINPLQSLHTNWEPLVRILRNFLQEGESRPLRSVVGIKLMLGDQNIFKEAGASTFKEYSSMASAAGIVQMGGEDAQAWIALLEQPASEAHSAADVLITPTYTPATVDHSPVLATCTETAGPDHCTSPPIAAQDAGLSANPSVLKPSALSTASTSSSLNHTSQPTMSPSAVNISSSPFEPLLEILRVSYAKGDYRLCRSSVVNQLLVVNPDAYIRLGMKSFHEYAAAAAAVDIVVLGGAEEDPEAWIALATRYIAESDDPVGHPPRETETQATFLSTGVGIEDRPDARAEGSTSPPTLAAVPVHFLPLMDVMRLLHAAGSSRPRRKELSGRLLRSDRRVYQKAGLPDFKTYIAAATAANLVVTGGTGSEAWVELQSGFGEAVLSSTLPPAHPLLPAAFTPLVQLLQAQLNAGYTRSNRTVINTILRKRHPMLYGKSSTVGKDFADYVYRARRAGVITVGGGEGDEPAWIALQEKWRGR